MSSAGEVSGMKFLFGGFFAEGFTQKHLIAFFQGARHYHAVFDDVIL